MNTGVKGNPIHTWAEDDRPREKLLMKGRSALSDAELLAILISTGTPEESAVGLAKKVLASAGNKLHELGKYSVADFVKTKGIGKAKAIAIMAALELGRRRKEEAGGSSKKILTSRDAYEYFKPLLEDNRHEEFWILMLSRSNRIIRGRKVSAGGVSGTVADPKIIFKYAIDELASAIVLCHNHPSGEVKPSPEDIRLTQKIKAAGAMLDIATVDHIIVGANGYYSFADENNI